jgi:transcriptional regulator with XRE-family HTH domain
MTIILDAGRARKNGAAVLHAFGRVGQVAVAEALGISESTVSRLKNSELEQWASLLAALGLKVVPVEMRCFNPEKIGAILTLAKDNLANITGPEGLTWEDPE